MNTVVPLFAVVAVFAVVGVVAAVVLIVTLTSTARSGPRSPTAAGSEERVIRRVRLLALVLGIATAWWVLNWTTTVDELGVNLMLAPVAFGLCVLLVTVLGELLVRPRFEEGPRTADLRPRRMRDHLPRVLGPLVGLTLLAAVLLCTFTLVTASPDDMGRAGRELFRVCSPTTSSGSGPYPGSHYVWPYAIGAGLAIAIAAAAVARITHRAVGGTPEQGDRYRAVATRAVVGALGVALSGPLAGIGFFAGTTLLRHSCAPTGWHAIGVAALLVTLLSMVTFAASVLSLLATGPSTASRSAAPPTSGHPEVRAHV